MTQSVGKEIYYISAVIGAVALAGGFVGLDAYLGQSDLRSDIKAVERAQTSESGGAERLSDEAFKDRVESALETIVAERRAEQESAQGNQQGGSATSGRVDATLDGSDAIYGNPEAPITLFVFADYNCPYCADFHPTVKDYVDRNEGDVNYIHMNYPVFGGESMQLANASECIKQEVGVDAYFAFMEAAYSADTLDGALQQLNVDAGMVRECTSDQRYSEKIQDNLAEGENFGISGTPTTLVRNNELGEGTVLPGAVPVNDLNRAVEEVANYGTD